MTDTIPPVSIPQETQVYLPSSTEKKMAVVMYLLIGIIGGLGKPEQSEYGNFHLKQAIGRWIIFVLLLLLSLILLFIPLVKYIPLIVFLGMIVVLVMCIKQASDGKYGRKKENSLSIFAGIGEWFMGLFDIKSRE